MLSVIALFPTAALRNEPRLRCDVHAIGKSRHQSAYIVDKSHAMDRAEECNRRTRSACQDTLMAQQRQLRLGAFMRPVSIHTGAWRYPGAYPDANFNLTHLKQFAQTLERGKFHAFFM